MNNDSSLMSLIRATVSFLFGCIAGFAVVQLLDAACTWLGVRGDVVDITVGYGVGVEREHDFRAAYVQMLTIPGLLIALAMARRRFIIPGPTFAGCILVGCLWSAGLAVDQFRISLLPVLVLELLLIILAVLLFLRQPLPQTRQN